jgi:hypothetical protein
MSEFAAESSFFSQRLDVVLADLEPVGEIRDLTALSLLAPISLDLDL